MTSKEESLFMASLAEQAGRFDDMVKFVNAAIKNTNELSPYVRSLFALSYRNAVGSRRTSWRALAALEHHEASTAGVRDPKTEQVRKYREIIEQEIIDYSTAMIDTIDKVILPVTLSSESKVFFNKLRGDYYRYLAEVTSHEAHKKAVDNAQKAYTKAFDISLVELPTTHPTRLGLALNFSVFFYEILNSPEKACLLAKAAFDDALSDINGLEEQGYKDAASIMQLLRDNLSLWTSDMVPSN